jgi:hypothetical protein
MHKDPVRPPRDQIRMTLGGAYQDNVESPSGSVFITLLDAATGEVLCERHLKNIVTLDTGILQAIQSRGGARYPTMLAIGTGATGNLLSPDAATRDQRALNNEISRKAFSQVTYRNGDGIAVSYPTHIVDYTTTFAESEAVGALNEMGLIAPFSSNPSTRNPILNGPSDYDSTIDVTGKDLLVNYLTFGVITKPNTAILLLTWRLTYGQTV